MREPDRSDALVGAARRLAQLLRTDAPEAARRGQLSRATVGALVDAELFRLLLPAELDGLEVEPATFVRVIEELARGDGSAAWIVSQMCVFSIQALYLAPDVARTLWARGASGLVANGQPVDARAVACDAGYRVSGRFAFSSGCRHARWLAAIAPVFDGDEPRMIAPGVRELRCFFVPVEEAEPVESWDVVGLRATGSHPFVLTGKYVPAAWTAPSAVTMAAEASPTYMITSNQYFAMGLAAVALGVAREALDTFAETSRTRTLAPQRQPVRSDPVAQQHLGMAEAAVRSARAFLLDAIGEAWTSMRARGVPPVRARALLRLASTHAMQESARAVDLVYAVGGTASIFEADRLQRCWQDLHVLTQHVQGRPSHIGMVGQIFFGLETDERFL
jgi:indole-3-acetate monooxygenase